LSLLRICPYYGFVPITDLSLLRICPYYGLSLLRICPYYGLMSIQYVIKIIYLLQNREHPISNILFIHSYLPKLYTVVRKQDYSTVKCTIRNSNPQSEIFCHNTGVIIHCMMKCSPYNIPPHEHLLEILFHFTNTIRGDIFNESTPEFSGDIS